MSLFSMFGFGSSPSDEAFNRNLGYIQQGIGAGTGALNNGYRRAQAMLGTGGGGDALSALNNTARYGRRDLNAGFDAAQNRLGELGTQLDRTITQGGGQIRSDLMSGFGDARNALGSAYGDTRRDLTAAVQGYTPMIQGGRRAFSGYMDAIGANGATGSDRALENFRAGPGYEFQQSQGQDAIMRSAAVRGGLAGGNTSVDLLKFSQGLADQSWNDYQNDLKTGADFLTTGLAGRNAALTNRANASQNYGTQAANLAQQRGTALSAAGQYLTGLRANAQQQVGMADAQMGRDRGNALADLGTRIGAAKAGLYGSDASNSMYLGNQLANLQLGGMRALTDNSNSLAQAENAEDANLLGGLLGLGKLGFSTIDGGLSNTVGGSIWGGVRNAFA